MPSIHPVLSLSVGVPQVIMAIPARASHAEVSRVGEAFGVGLTSLPQG